MTCNCIEMGNGSQKHLFGFKLSQLFASARVTPFMTISYL